MFERVSGGGGGGCMSRFPWLCVGLWRLVPGGLSLYISLSVHLSISEGHNRGVPLVCVGICLLVAEGQDREIPWVCACLYIIGAQ